MRLILALAVSILAATSAAASDLPCGGEIPCTLGERSYHVLPPDGWDGETPLPVLLHFHGWGRVGGHVLKNGRIAAHTRRRGVLLVAPDGERRTWDFWRAQSPDVVFTEAVLDDVARRFPVDRAHVYVSGYSYGAAMAWRFACERGGRITGLLAVAGTLPQATDCPEAPRVVRHVHGLTDTVLDFPFGPHGEDSGAVALWRAHLGCGAGEDGGSYSIRPFLTISRMSWDCARGHVTLDTHPGGHFIPHGWFGWQLDQLMGRPPVYP